MVMKVNGGFVRVSVGWDISGEGFRLGDRYRGSLKAEVGMLLIIYYLYCYCCYAWIKSFEELYTLFKSLKYIVSCFE